MPSPNSVSYRGQEFCLVRKARVRRFPVPTRRENERARPRAGKRTAAQRVALKTGPGFVAPRSESTAAILRRHASPGPILSATKAYGIRGQHTNVEARSRTQLVLDSAVQPIRPAAHRSLSSRRQPGKRRQAVAGVDLGLSEKAHNPGWYLADATPVFYRMEFIGKGEQVLKVHETPTLIYEFTGRGLIVRVWVTDSDGKTASRQPLVTK